ncbi:SMI1/KNR4 family protein [Kitasatospora sp. NPDC088351]|uniref:SMI1/KNR4 family protein n=1 Tax=Kitasatospora sp. NPDC088351 TaxID=3155180 RepID=UPI003442C25A
MRPGATGEQIADLERGLGFRLHPRVRALLSRHNGVTDPRPEYGPDFFPAGSFLPLGHRLLDTDRILTRHRSFAKIFKNDECDPTDRDEQPLYAHAHLWVPLALPNDGGVLFMDHCPGPTYGRIYEMGVGSGDIDGSLWATDLTNLVTSVAASLETGQPFRYFAPKTLHHASGRHRIHWRVLT